MTATRTNHAATVTIIRNLLDAQAERRNSVARLERSIATGRLGDAATYRAQGRLVLTREALHSITMQLAAFLIAEPEAYVEASRSR